ncbi:Fc.00g101270.m01.CDS01 [Cosmosporella sp. VM-42]
MTNLPSQHPTVSLHLSDVTLTPLITSSSSQSHLESLTSLTTSALTAQTAAQRVNLGRPQRIMVEYPDRGAVVLQSYLDPRDVDDRPAVNGDAETSTSKDEKPEDGAPMLVGLVVAGSADDVREARRAAARLERVGREFQKEWAVESFERGNEEGPE